MSTVYAVCHFNAASIRGEDITTITIMFITKKERGKKALNTRKSINERLKNFK